MSDQRLTPAQFRALYRYALNPSEDSARESTRRSLIALGLLRFDHLASLGEVRPRFAVTNSGWQELDQHLVWLSRHRTLGRDEFERSMGANVDAASADLIQADHRAAQEALRDRRTGVLYLRTDHDHAERIIGAQELPADADGRVWLSNRRDGAGEVLLRVALFVEDAWERQEEESGRVRYAVPASAVRDRAVYRA